MITKVKAATIKKYLGSQPSPKILEHLNKKQILNSIGKPYQLRTIQKIVKGDEENTAIEIEIFKMVAKAKKAKSKAVQFIQSVTKS